MNLKVLVKKPIAIKYGFDEQVPKEEVIQKVKLLRPKDWGTVINIASNGKISNDIGFLLSAMVNVGVTQAHWYKDRNSLVTLCEQIEKQDNLEKRLHEVLDDLNNNYTKVIEGVYLKHKTHKEVASNLGIDASDIPNIINGFFYSINFSEFYSWIIKGCSITSDRKLLMKIGTLSPSTVMRLTRMGLAYVDEVQDTLRGINTVEGGVARLKESCKYTYKNTRLIIEDLANSKIIDVVNLRNIELKGNIIYNENDPYTVLSKSVLIDGQMVIETYMIRNLHMSNRALKKAINELVLNNDNMRLDSVRLHSNDHLGRPIYQIVCSRTQEMN